jgi:tetratricopeptide (TPR) repeat protein
MKIQILGLFLVMVVLIACGRSGGSNYSEEMDRIDSNGDYSYSGGPIVEAHSLMGAGLVRPDFDEETTAQLTNNLREAVENYHENPDDVESIIWVGRRTAYLWRYQDAILVFSDGISEYPDDPRLYRHRGHRYITVREFNNAVDDLTKATELIANIADEIEPDGAPNEANIPVTTLYFNIYYHLGLAHYLLEEFSDAAKAFEMSLAVSKNNDTMVSSIDWLYITYRRMGEHSKAKALLSRVDRNTKVLESQSYLRRLLMYKGLEKPENLLGDTDANPLDLVTQGYGVAMWYMHEGDHQKAIQILEDIIETNYWAAFGYIAAEADLARFQALSL